MGKANTLRAVLMCPCTLLISLINVAYDYSFGKIIPNPKQLSKTLRLFILEKNHEKSGGNLKNWLFLKASSYSITKNPGHS